MKRKAATTIDEAARMGFAQGVAYAAAELSRAFDAPSYAMELLCAAGLTDAKALRAADVDEYDARECRSVIRREKRP